MSLIRQSEALLGMPQEQPSHVGVVVVNDDPLRQKRLKVLVAGRFEVPASQYDRLPWVFPDDGAGSGGRADSGNFSVPEVGAEVKVRFIDDDPYTARYSIGTENSSFHSADLFDDNYPKVEGGVDSEGNFNRTDRELGFREGLRAAGNYISEDADGNTVVRIPKNLLVFVEGKMQLSVLDALTQIIGGAFAHKSASDTYEVAGAVNVEIGGAHNVKSASASYISAADYAVKAAAVGMDSAGAVNVKAADIGLAASGDIAAKAGGSFGIGSGGATNIKAGGNLNTDGAQHQSQVGAASPGEPGAPVATVEVDVTIVAEAVEVVNATAEALQERISELEGITESLKEEGQQFNQQVVAEGITEILEMPAISEVMPISVAMPVLQRTLEAVPTLGNQVAAVQQVAQAADGINNSVNEIERMGILLTNVSTTITGALNSVNSGTAWIEQKLGSVGGDLTDLLPGDWDEINTVNAIISGEVGKLQQLADLDNQMSRLRQSLVGQSDLVDAVLNGNLDASITGPLITRITGALDGLSNLETLASSARGLLTGPILGRIGESAKVAKVFDTVSKVGQQVSALKGAVTDITNIIANPPALPALPSIPGLEVMRGATKLLNGGQISANIGGVLGRTNLGGHTRSVLSQARSAQQRIKSLREVASRFGV